MCGVQLAYAHDNSSSGNFIFSTFPSYLQTTICYHLFFLEFHVLFLFFLHPLYKMMIKMNQLVVSKNELNFLVLPKKKYLNHLNQT